MIFYFIPLSRRLLKFGVSTAYVSEANTMFNITHLPWVTLIESVEYSPYNEEYYVYNHHHFFDDINSRKTHVTSPHGIPNPIEKYTLSEVDVGIVHSWITRNR